MTIKTLKFFTFFQYFYRIFQEYSIFIEIFLQRLIGSRKLPGQRIKEVDVISRKKVPYYQERELYEGPAQYQVIQGGEREYVSATSTATNGVSRKFFEILKKSKIKF